MFRKKKDPTSDSGAIKLQYDLDRRDYFRVKPTQNQPVWFRVGERQWRVDDLSAGGLSLDRSGLPLGRHLTGQLILPGYDQPLDLTLSIVRSGPDIPTSCSLDEISERRREILHQFVLSRQKNDLVADQEREADRIRRQHRNQLNRKKS